MAKPCRSWFHSDMKAPYGDSQRLPAFLGSEDLWQVLGRKRFYRVTSKVCCRGLSEELEISGELEHGTAMVAQNWWIWTSQGRATCRIQGICLALSALSPKDHPCGRKCGAMAVCVVFSTLFSWTGHSAMPLSWEHMRTEVVLLRNYLLSLSIIITSQTTYTIRFRLLVGWVKETGVMTMLIVPGKLGKKGSGPPKEIAQFLQDAIDDIVCFFGGLLDWCN